jgi:integrase
MRAALALDWNTGLRDKELRQIRWLADRLGSQEDAHGGQVENRGRYGARDPAERNGHRRAGGARRLVPRRFMECRPEWFMFAFGKPLPKDPTRPITSFKTAWSKVRQKADVKGRWHDNRHTLVTELAESGAGDEVIMSIAGHVSRAMLSRYSHVRMEAKRRALDEIASRQRAADEKRREEAAQQQPTIPLQSAVVQ